MSFEQMTFDECKVALVRMAGLVSKASNAQELSALLLADTAAPYHTFDPLAYPNLMANVVDRIGMLMYDGMDGGDEEAVA